MSEYLCLLCKHTESVHEIFIDGNEGDRPYCQKCLNLTYKLKHSHPWPHKFKLDNLDLIEQLAKQKGLV
jgi:hypothetical protein